MITIDGGTGAISHNGVKFNKESDKMVDQWRIDDTSVTGTNIINSGWERCDDSTFVKIGTGMSESSGIFTFPQTGVYLIKMTFCYSSNGRSYVGVKIYATTNNSSYTDIADSYDGSVGGNQYSAGYTEAIFDCTDTSTHKVAIYGSTVDTSTMAGAGDKHRSGVTFIRLGDT